MVDSMQAYLNELIRRKDLLGYLVVSGLKAQHRNSLLGYLWWLLDPLLGVGIYYFLVVVLMDRGGENFGGFLVIGMIAWRWVSATVKVSGKSISGQASIISKVYLPKVIFPLGTALTQLINFLFGLVIIAAYLVWSKTIPTMDILWLPYVIFIQFLFMMALSMVISYICVFIRDIDTFMTHFVRLWFYASPVIWEQGRLPAKYNWIVALNPISAILKSYRNILMHGQAPAFERLLVIGLVSIAVIGFMIFYFSRNEHKIIKVL